jgi:hypothetical protein
MIVWALSALSFLLSLTQAWVGYAIFGDVFAGNATIKLGLLDGAGTFEGNVVAVFLIVAPLLLALAWLPGSQPDVRRPLRGAALAAGCGLLMIEVVIAVRPNQFLRNFATGQSNAEALSGTYYAMAMTILAVAAASIGGWRWTAARPEAADGPAAPGPGTGRPRLHILRPTSPVAALAGVAAAAAFTGSLWQPWMAAATTEGAKVAAVDSLFDTPFGPPFMVVALMLLALVGAAAMAGWRFGPVLRSAVLALSGPIALVLLLMLKNPARFILRPLLPGQDGSAALYQPRSGMYLAVFMVFAGCLAAVSAHPLRARDRRPNPGPAVDGSADIAAS